MTRTFTPSFDPEKPTIRSDDVASFFEERARRISRLGPLRAVLYQDHHPDLAERRDEAERQALGPLLALERTSRLLDIGCGTGRWVPSVADRCAAYHGIDLSPGLIAFARSAHVHHPNCSFSVCSATDLSLSALGEEAGFDRVLCAGLFIYLNDDDARTAFGRIAEVSAPACRLVLREPMATDMRLTLSDHFSDELGQHYNAIYRTETELVELAAAPLLQRGFRISGSGDLFSDPTLNNRTETRQRWILMERGG